MKVVWLVSNYPSQYNLTSGIFYQRMAEALALKSIYICVIAPTPYSNSLLGKISTRWSIYRKYPEFEIKNGVKIYRPRYLALPGQNKYISTPYLIYLAIRHHLVFDDANIIDAHYAFPFGYVARLLSRKYKIPHVVSFRGDDVNIDPYYSKKTNQYFIKSVEKSTAQIAVSKAIAKKAKELSGVEPIVVNVGLELPQKLIIMERKKNKVFTFVFVGALTRDKGLHLIVELLKENENLSSNNFSWVVIGEGPFGDQLSQFSNVILPGKLPNKEVLEYMIDADLMVFPSLHEGMPNVLKEAGSVALPIIASDVGGIPDLLNFGERGLLFKRNDYNNFKESLFCAMDDYEIMLGKAKKLQKYIYDNFDINKNVDQLIAVYNQVLNK
jgi:teichuronic acid biosynthesis glycosyltransferase TuaC